MPNIKPVISASYVVRDLLNEARNLGFTYTQIAREMGINYVTITNWSRGVSCPDALHLEALAQVMGYTLCFSKYERGAVPPDKNGFARRHDRTGIRT